MWITCNGQCPSLPINIVLPFRMPDPPVWFCMSAVPATALFQLQCMCGRLPSHNDLYPLSAGHLLYNGSINSIACLTSPVVAGKLAVLLRIRAVMSAIYLCRHLHVLSIILRHSWSLTCRECLIPGHRLLVRHAWLPRSSGLLEFQCLE